MKLWKEAITLHIVVPGKTIAPWFMGKKLQLLSSTFKRNSLCPIQQTDTTSIFQYISTKTKYFLKYFLIDFKSDIYLDSLSANHAMFSILHTCKWCHCIMQLEHRNKTNQLTLEKFFFLNELQQESWQYK